MIIGITGKSVSGKTTITDLLNRNNDYEIIHVDDITHIILDFDEVKEELKSIYGNEIFDSNQKIDTKKLGGILFNNLSEIKKYNQFIYKYIEIYIDSIIASSDKDIIIDWMQLPLSKYFTISDFNILVDAPLEIRKSRVENRDNIDSSYFLSREKNALEYDTYNFDYVIINDGNSVLEKVLKLNKELGRKI